MTGAGISALPRILRPRRSFGRSCVAVVGLCFALHAGFGFARSVVGAQEPAVLDLGATVERELSRAQTHTYQLPITAGDFLRITVEQRGIDVGVTIVRPDGRTLVSVDASDDDFRPETVVAIADASGIHTIDVRTAPSAGPNGRYRIRIDERRRVEPGDDIRIEAARAYERGTAMRKTRQPSDLRDGLAQLEKARDAYRRVGDRHGEMTALIDVSMVQMFLFMPTSLALAREAEQIARELHDEAAIATSLYAQATAHDQEGDLIAAQQAYEASAAITRAIGNRKSEVRILNGEGIAAMRLGNDEQAVALYERARRLMHEVMPSTASEYLILNNQAAAYEHLGQYDKALDAYERALAGTRAAKNRDFEAIILNNASIVHRERGDLQKALAMQTTALNISRETGGRESQWQSLATIADTSYLLGDYAKTVEHQRLALAIARELNDAPSQAASLDGAGRAMHRLGDDDGALTMFREALDIARAIRDQRRESGVLRNIAALERDRKDLRAALSDVTTAVDLDEAMRGRITSPELRTTYVAARQDKYELLIDVLQQLHAANPGDGHDRAALQVSERARARVLLESLLDARVDLHEGIDPELLERERALQKQLGDASSQLSRLLARKDGESQPLAAARNLDRLTAEYQLLQAEIRERSPRYAAVTQPRPLDVAAIQQSVVDDETVLLEFALGEERSWLWAVTPTSLTSVELPPLRDIDAEARSLYALLTTRQKRRGETSGAYAARVATAERKLHEQAAAVSRMLLAGIAQPLNDQWRRKRLAIVASGSLEYLPFAALPIPGRRPAVPLAAAHEIVTIPSASVLAVMRREAAGRTPAPRTLAVLADPVFDDADPRIGARNVSAPAARDVDAPRALDVIDSMYARGSSWTRLPFSRDEANAIAALAGTGALKAIDFKASRVTALSGALSGHRIVHFATHGVLDSERPALSALILSLVDERGARQNGYLRLADIYNMRLDADLVVLSACQTALGKEIKGEGLVGLTRAFIYAGAPRVVASLWQVNDLATAELMKQFYRGMLQQHLRPSAALRAAQLQMSRDPRWAAPYYWAGFVLQGEWR